MRSWLASLLFLSSCRLITNQLGVASCEAPDGAFLACDEETKIVCQSGVEVFVDCGEACTDDTTGRGCAADLLCGDGFVKPGEECDDGAQNSDTAPDSCRTDCSLPSCGDGALDEGEGCDDGASNSDELADACRTDCTPARCGDGALDSGEGCDDGASNANTAACTLACEVAVCGDGFVLSGVEGCDDADDIDNDECTNDCTLPGCGDGILQAGEGCDDGAENSNSGACTTLCQDAVCGDSLLRSGVETCDDGNTTSLDGCDAACQDEFCGDGIDNDGSNEQCDLGASNSNIGACTASCQNAICGDTFIRSGFEGCDDGNTTSGDGCNSQCQDEFCGDNSVNDNGAEQCDLGATNSDSGTCTTDCESAFCGDALLRTAGANPEGCDDGGNFSGDGCSSGCVVESGFSCAGVPSDCDTVCGDGLIRGVEACDGANFNGQSCNGLGFDGGALSCSASCTIDPSGCTDCGDGLVEAPETCDPGGDTSTLGCTLCVASVGTCQSPVNVTEAPGSPPPFTTVNNTSAGAGNNLTGGAACAGQNGREQVFRFLSPPATSNVSVTVTPNGARDMSVYLYTVAGACNGATVIQSCGDQFTNGIPETTSLNNVAPGTNIFIVVDSKDAAGEGPFSLSISL